MFMIDTGASAPPINSQTVGDGTGFAKHGIDHLSASSINLWTNAPDVWVAKYIGGMRSEYGPAPVRGQCVEDAVAAVLRGSDMTSALAAALDRFDSTFPRPDEKALKERGLITDMAKIAVDELDPLGTPEFDGERQQKVRLRCNFGDWSVDLIGYLDFQFPEAKVIADLKTTTRVPSSMSADHRIQRCIYAAARPGYDCRFLYVSTKKTAWLEDGDVSETLAKVKMQVARMERFLAHHDAESALACVPHNPNSFFWSGDEAARHQFFGT